MLTLTYWHVGKKINEHILNNQRAEYGKQIVPTLSAQLEKSYGRNFNEKNLRRMMRFAEVFSEFPIVVPLVRQLSWSHFVELLPLKNKEQRIYYANKIAEEKWSIRETRYQIERKAYERNEIAAFHVTDDFADMQNTPSSTALDRVLRYKSLLNGIFGTCCRF